MSARPLKLAIRIEAAVLLQPMTIRELARCLGSTPQSIEKAVGRADVERIGTRSSRTTGRTRGRPWIVFGPSPMARLRAASNIAMAPSVPPPSTAALEHR
jgi:hypothetical protein